MFLPPIPKCKVEKQQSPFRKLLKIGAVVAGKYNLAAKSGARGRKIFYFMSLLQSGIVEFDGTTLDLSDGSEPMAVITNRHLNKHAKVNIDKRIKKVLDRQFPVTKVARFATPSAAATWVKSYASGKAHTTDGWMNFWYEGEVMDTFRDKYSRELTRKSGFSTSTTTKQKSKSKSKSKLKSKSKSLQDTTSKKRRHLPKMEKYDIVKKPKKETLCAPKVASPSIISVAPKGTIWNTKERRSLAKSLNSILAADATQGPAILAIIENHEELNNTCSDLDSRTDGERHVEVEFYKLNDACLHALKSFRDLRSTPNSLPYVPINV